MIPQSSNEQSVPPPEKSLKYMAWSIKEIAASLKEIAAALNTINNRVDRFEAAMLKGARPMAPAVQTMVDDAKKKAMSLSTSEEVPF